LWIQIGKLLKKLKMNGISIPFQDAALSYLAIKHSISIWTKDKHFNLIKSIYQELKIYGIH